MKDRPISAYIYARVFGMELKEDPQHRSEGFRRCQAFPMVRPCVLAGNNRTESPDRDTHFSAVASDTPSVEVITESILQQMIPHSSDPSQVFLVLPKVRV